MADFCFEAARVMWGDGAKNDVAGLCKPGEMVAVLCEGMPPECPGGVHYVDHDGKTVR